MKKFFFCLAVFAAMLFVFAGCGSSGSNDKSGQEEASADDDADKDSPDKDTDKDTDSGKTDDDTESDGDPDTDPGQPDDSGTGGDEPETTVSCSELDGVSGELTTCVNGECETDDCPGSNSCKNATECGECRNYEEECLEKDSGWGVYRCKVGTYSLVKECAQGCNESWDDCGTIECNDDETKCENGNDGIGIEKTCVNGKWDEGVTCEGSCNSQMTKCGEDKCIDYTVECKNGLLGDGESGAIAQCQFGKWQIMSTCTDGASCNKETGDCGECKNGNTKCENHEISGIMNKSCNYQGECETDSNGNLKYYSATIGVLVLCYDGRWSDYNDLTRSSYCPPVNHTFQIYKNYSLTDWSTAMTKVYRSANTYDDYHYSSCHNSGAVSECGTCHNSFHVCGDEYYSNKLVGHILNCQNGMLTYGNYCGDKNQLCQDITQCK